MSHFIFTVSGLLVIESDSKEEAYAKAEEIASNTLERPFVNLAGTQSTYLIDYFDDYLSSLEFNLRIFHDSVRISKHQNKNVLSYNLTSGPSHYVNVMIPLNKLWDYYHSMLDSDHKDAVEDMLYLADEYKED